MKKVNILLLLFMMMPFALKSQNLGKLKDVDKNKKFMSIVRLSYIKGNKDTAKDNAYAYSLNAILGYYIIPKRLSMGIGGGFDFYEESSFNSAPLFLNIHFDLTSERNIPYIYANLGALLKLSSNSIDGGTREIGLGYKFFVSKKLCLNAELGYAGKGVSFTEGVALSIGATLF